MTGATDTTLPQLMTAAVLVAHGGPEALELRHDVPLPTLAAGHVLIRVAAAGVNNTDLWSRRGAYGTPEDPDAIVGWQGVPLYFPRIQGGDAVGHVVAAGDAAGRQLIGRRVLIDPITYGDDPRADEPTIKGVMGSESDGAFAQYLCVPTDRAHDVTTSPLTDEQLACLPIAYGTATGMLERAEVVAGDRIVVTGASGGVGLALVQLAAARGAEVIAVTNSAAVDAVRRAGAAATVLRDQVDDVIAACHALAPDGVDVVADVVGGRTFTRLMDVLCTGGRLVTCGAVAGPVVELDLRVLYLRRRRLIGSTMHTPDQFRRMVQDANSGAIEPVVARTYDLDQIGQAQRDFEHGGLIGNLILLPGRTDRISSGSST
ncbi:MAG: NADPH:quinone reductase-like Zn-dependent oxidoreductase [Nitriliruptoraceae bacterium]|jgi:NADPH:quinone reductase-like Zn-dependent oxidoreductase